jgi:hypothetical protein
MATDEELEAELGVSPSSRRAHLITEDEWRELKRTLEHISRRVDRLCGWFVLAMALVAAWVAASRIGNGWVALSVAFATFIIVGALFNLDLDRDDPLPWLRRWR